MSITSCLLKCINESSEDFYFRFFNPHIFHTFIYSMENDKYQAERDFGNMTVDEDSEWCVIFDENDKVCAIVNTKYDSDWNSLEICQFKEYVSGFGPKLITEVSNYTGYSIVFSDICGKSFEEAGFSEKEADGRKLCFRNSDLSEKELQEFFDEKLR